MIQRYKYPVDRSRPAEGFDDGNDEVVSEPVTSTSDESSVLKDDVQ